MDFIAYYEYDPKDYGQIIKKFQEIMAIRKSDPDKFPKIKYGAVQMAGQHKGFAIYENSTTEQMNALVIYWMPLLSTKFVSLTPASEFVEMYMKMKK